MKNDIKIDHKLLNLIADIDEFKGRWDFLQVTSPDQLLGLRKVATIESIGSSTRIEGATLSDLQVEILLSKVKITPFETRDEQEIFGYAEAMDTVLDSFLDLKITENHIKQLHQILLKYSTKDERHRGEYKKISNHVVAIDNNGKEIGVIFATATPFATPSMMEELVKHINNIIEEKIIHPLLITAIFIVRFLAIHPFQDGNGRLSRILTTLFLLRFGYNYVSYASLEQIIEENKDLYYKALRNTQKTLNSEQQNLEPWINFFLKSLKKQKDRLLNKLNNNQLMHMADLSTRIIELLKIHQKLNISMLVKLTQANPNTLKLRLRQLVSSQKIVRHGRARATWYTIKI